MISEKVIKEAFHSGEEKGLKHFYFQEPEGRRRSDKTCGSRRRSHRSDHKKTCDSRRRSHRRGHKKTCSSRRRSHRSDRKKTCGSRDFKHTKRKKIRRFENGNMWELRF